MGTVLISISADWDGDYGYTVDNIALVQARFHKDKGKFRNIPITHFITPVYFTRTDKILEGRYIQGIQGLRENTNCEIGLHVHCWESLIRFLGIQRYLDADHGTSWDSSNAGKGQFDPILTSAGKDEGAGVLEYGHSVPLWFYQSETIERILDLSRRVLTNKLDMYPADIRGFRCGGWMSDDKVLKALIKLGFAYDASAVDLSVCDTEVDPRGELAAFTLYIGQIWGKTARSARLPMNTLYHGRYPNGVATLANAQPARIAFEGKSIIEIPNTCCLADYVSADRMIAHVEEAIGLAKSHEQVCVSLGFHIDTANSFLDRIETVVSKFQAMSGVRFVTCAEQA